MDRERTLTEGAKIFILVLKLWYVERAQSQT
jgi:hypothetical protein